MTIPTGSAVAGDGGAAGVPAAGVTGSAGAFGIFCAERSGADAPRGWTVGTSVRSSCTSRNGSNISPSATSSLRSSSDGRRIGSAYGFAFVSTSRALVTTDGSDSSFLRGGASRSSSATSTPSSLRKSAPRPPPFRSESGDSPTRVESSSSSTRSESDFGSIDGGAGGTSTSLVAVGTSARTGSGAAAAFFRSFGGA